jgi:hypothetical protein
MSDLFQYLISSPNVQFSKVSFDYAVDPNVIPNDTVTKYDICPDKSGALQITINLGELYPGLNVSAIFTGADAGVDSSGNRLIVWSIGQTGGPTLDLAGTSITVNSVEGQFTTVLAPINPYVQQISCQGENTYYGATIATTGDNNGFVVRATANVFTSPVFTVTVTNFAAVGLVSNPRDLAVTIQTPGTLCSSHILVGGQGKSFALIKGIPAGAIPTLRWTVTGGGSVIQGPSDQSMVIYTTPTADLVTVSVKVTASDQQAVASCPVYAIEPIISRLLFVVCELRSLSYHSWDVNPLVDPLFAFRTPITTEPNLERIIAYSKRMGALAKQMESLSSEVLRSGR